MDNTRLQLFVSRNKLKVLLAQGIKTPAELAEKLDMKEWEFRDLIRSHGEEWGLYIEPHFNVVKRNTALNRFLTALHEAAEI